ncbi:2-hydroxychromene-2-carboxylate isomerase [Elioraea sp.]|uniref:2-hydroxychromene-2-carboxylate isomerase n=1 Tax=Elioraea sp. TaxID=2185103 RepID=UPI0025C3378A|nr:2-hydroxychromene-2-carboxylate isomerase [Elioraea sp.]
MTDAIEYFHSLSSPWAYLGGPRLAEIAARYRVPILCRPITVLTENGGVLLRTRPDARQRYHEVELDRWRRHLGMPLNLRPKHYPTDPKPAALVVIAARRAGHDAAALSHAFLRALWAEERDTKDAGVLAAIADAEGLPGAALVAAAAAPEVEAEWTANRAAAIAGGMFGTPNYVWRGVIHWGQDRLDFLERLVAQDTAPAIARGRHW